MSSTLTNVIVALGTLTIVVVACMTWVRRKQRDLDELVSALRSFNSLGYNLRLDDGLEERLHTGLNRALTGMGRRHEIAERRGLEWERAVDSIDGIVVVCSADGKITRANTKLADTLGVDIRSVVGEQLQSYLNHDGECPIELTVSSERPVVSLLALNRLGSRMKLTTSLVQRPDGERMVIAVLVEAPDEEAPTAAPNSWHGLAHAVPGPAVLADPTSSKVLTVNQAFTSTFGYDALCSLRLGELLANEDESSVAALRRTAFDKKHEPVRLELKNADGSTVDATVRGSLCRTASGAPASMLLTFDIDVPATDEDVTLLAAAMENTHDGVLICDLQGKVLRANATAIELYQRSAEEMNGAPLDGFHIERIDPNPGAIGPWEAVRADGGWKGELLRVHPDGACVPTRVSVSRVPRPDMDDAAVVVVHDLSVEREMQDEVMRSQKLATLGELSGSISHEISNPLTAVLESARCLVEDLAELDVSAEISESAEDCLDAAKRMRAILSEVRKFAHMGSGSPEMIRLDDVVRSALVLAGPSINRHAKVELPKTPGPEVFAHAGQLSQVIVNLMKNAAEAIAETKRPGTIRVEYGTHQGSGLLRIIDDGPGIPMAVQQRLFKDYVTTKALGTGTGFGLRLCAKLITDNDGEIAVESAPNAGATFTVSLPLQRRMDSEKPDSAITSPALSVAPPEQWDSEITMQDLDAESAIEALSQAAGSRDTLPFG